MKTIIRTTFDIKVVSIFLFISSFMYFCVNPNKYPLLGTVLIGYPAQILWVTSCLICLLASYGFWKKKLYAWKMIMGYSLFCLVNIIVNFFFLSCEERASIITENNYMDSDYSLFFFLLSLALEILFVFYLLKRRKVFT